MVYEWSGDELRKESVVEPEVDRSPLPAHAPACDVDQIRERVEREEGDADREVDGPEAERRGAESGGRSVQVVDQEVGVFEAAEEREVRGDRNGEHARAPPGPIERPAEEIVGHDGAAHDQDEAPLATG